ncbi:MBL fold metallo-hydrolase [Sphingobacterium sp. BIGb0165]|uniref:MBL fold metallo-hydrolase n=1 Tax=Sphingobacterium sp. BIGb0165 TaxID=2940615 RepID=UPI00216824A9|nr:MBL fold metallo-hydrolase [Sphingobacterium sp. BIGb0165]MCS4229266.1 L-ascorbate metabolism protein UlaG (beta-lactamase superfamily)/quinol monooxygenase YgiN [Sphingobacterium sp. BIGb0165]
MNNTLHAQQQEMMVRISEIEIHPQHLEEYKIILKEEAEASVRLEKGVIAIFPMFQKDNPTQVRILEMYKDQEAYQSHLKTEHFLKYKTTTLHMVKALKLVDMDALDPDAAVQIFKKVPANKKYQATPPAPKPFGAEAFQKSDKTVIRWMGNGGFFINSRGTTLMVDPLLKGFDMPVLFNSPIEPKDIPHLDAVLITHSDNDHYSIPTLKELSPVTKIFHSTVYVDSLMKNEGFRSKGHRIGDQFKVRQVKVRLTPADHDWQNQNPTRTRNFLKEDFAGFLLDTPDGTIWAQGDSRLMQEHLNLPAPDAIFFDFSDNEWHFTLEGALKIANAYPDTPLLLSHWGTIDAPDFTPFNADPEKLKRLVKNPERVIVLAPGEEYTLKPLKKP